jgi:hypothetical protein
VFGPARCGYSGTPSTKKLRGFADRWRMGLISPYSGESHQSPPAWREEALETESSIAACCIGNWHAIVAIV